MVDLFELYDNAQTCKIGILNRTISKPRWRYDGVKINYKEKKQKGVGWMHPAHCKNQYIALVYIIAYLPSESTKVEESYFLAWVVLLPEYC